MTVRLRLAALVLLASTTACSPRSDHAASNVGAAADNAFQDIGNAASNAVDAAGDALSTTPSAQEFVDKAARSDAFEIAAAKLAETNSDNSAVKGFATRMIAAHTESTAKVKAAAAKAQPAVTPDATLSSSQQDKLADLAKLKGADFDKAYLDGQVDAHEDALSLMRSYAEHGDSAPLKDVAAKIRPVVEQHLADAKALRK